MFMICVHINFQTPSSTGSLVSIQNESYL